MGRFMDRFIPKTWHVFGYPLNPGPFNMKEHVLITIFANVGAGIPYAVDIVTLVKNPAFYGSIGGSIPFLACLIFVNTTPVGGSNSGTGGLEVGEGEGEGEGGVGWGSGEGVGGFNVISSIVSNRHEEPQL